MVDETDCAICFLRYNRGARAPRRLRCGHALCTLCLREMLLCSVTREVTYPRRGGRAPKPQVTCPFCRAVTSQLDAETSLPLELGLWERLGPDATTEEEEPPRAAPQEEGENGAPPLTAGKWNAWRALKAALRGRSNRTPARTTHRQALGDDDMRDLALMTCYII